MELWLKWPAETRPAVAPNSTGMYFDVISRIQGGIH
jgi:hypothetical protein